MTYNIKNKDSIVVYSLKGLMPDEALTKKDYDIFKNIKKYDNTWDIKTKKNSSGSDYFIALYYADDCYLVHEQPLTAQEIENILKNFKPSLIIDTDTFNGWQTEHHPFKKSVGNVTDFLMQNVPDKFREAVELVEDDNKVNIIQFLSDFWTNR